MRVRILLLPALYWLCAAPGGLPADDDIVLPLPKIVNEDVCRPFSSIEFTEQMRKLKAERTALAEAMKALAARPRAMPKDDNDAQLQTELKTLLQRLHQARAAAPAEAVPLPRPKEFVIDKNAETPELKKDSEGPALKPADPGSGPVDVLAQAHMLFRAHQYEEALNAFKQVDLKGKRAETRAPVQYLMAICLLHLGKPDEAVPLFREAANSRGDDKTAAYAQWQIEMVRWQRDTQSRLQQIRERRLALEKRE